jgi:two-component system sensor histidine kinase ChvG
MDAELSRESPRSLDLGRFLGDICALYPVRKPEDVAVALSPPDLGKPLLAAGREGPLGQVFRNLIDNARSFSPPGGEVRISVGSDRYDGARFVAIQVEDDGPGIPPENLETVFQRFYTNRPKGHAPGGAAFGGHSGLGLAIARQIVEAHSGRLQAENRVGPKGEIQGARFTVLLPAVGP